MTDLIPINVIIGDRSYRIKVAPADEEAVRRTVKTINEKFTEFKTQFAGKDMQDYIAMVLLWYATQQKAADKPLLPGDLSHTLQEIEDLLDKQAGT